MLLLLFRSFFSFFLFCSKRIMLLIWLTGFFCFRQFNCLFVVGGGGAASVVLFFFIIIISVVFYFSFEIHRKRKALSSFDYSVIFLFCTRSVALNELFCFWLLPVRSMFGFYFFYFEQKKKNNFFFLIWYDRSIFHCDLMWAI